MCCNNLLDLKRSFVSGFLEPYAQNAANLSTTLGCRTYQICTYLQIGYFQKHLSTSYTLEYGLRVAYARTLYVSGDSLAYIDFATCCKSRGINYDRGTRWKLIDCKVELCWKIWFCTSNAQAYVAICSHTAVDAHSITQMLDVTTVHFDSGASSTEMSGFIMST